MDQRTLGSLPFFSKIWQAKQHFWEAVANLDCKEQRLKLIYFVLNAKTNTTKFIFRNAAHWIIDPILLFHHILQRKTISSRQNIKKKKFKPSLKLSWKERLSKKNSSNFPILHQITHQMKRLGRILENNNLQEHQFKKRSRKLKRLCLQREGSQWSKGKHRSSFPKNNWGWVSMELPLS